MCAVRSSSRGPFSISVVPDRDRVAVVPSGELDIASAGTLEREVRELRQSGFTRIVVDLRAVDFMDSTGLRVLLTLHNDGECDGHVLELVPGPRQVERIFDVTATRALFRWREA